MSCRHVSATGYRCSRPPLPAHRGFCRQHASQLQLPPPVPPSQPSRRGGRVGGAAVVPMTPAPTPAVPHAAPDAGARRRSSSVGRTPTVEQLLARIDRLRASSPSAESAWSEDSDHETPTLGSSRQYAGSGCAGDSSSAESGGEGPETVEALGRAGVYTAEEAALVSRDKLVRQQALYIQQFSRLQHLLREGRRRYLHELKLERQAEAEAAKERQLAAEAGEEDSERSDAVPGRSGGRGAAPRNQHDAEEKLRAAWRYHRHRGLSQVMRRRAWDRRSDTPAPPGPRCVHTEGGVRCSERCLPGSKFCVRHILSDPHQMLFVPCAGRRSLTLQQRDEEFARSRRKARRTATAAAAASRGAATTASRPPAPVSSRTSARACARGTNPAVAAVLAARGRARPRVAPTPARTAARAPPPPPAPPAAGRRRAVVGVVAPIPRSKDAARAVAARAGTRASTNTSAGANASTTASAVGTTGGSAGGSTGGTRPARPATAVKSEAPAPAQAAPAPSAARKAWNPESVNLEFLQRQFKTKQAKDIIAAVRSQDAAAFAAAIGVEKTPSIEKMVRRRTVARMVDAMERGDAAALVAAAKAAAEKPGTRHVMEQARKIAATASVLRSEEAVRFVAALKSEDPEVVFAALKSKDAVAVLAALRARAAAGPSAARGPGVPPSESRDPAKVPAGAAVGVPTTRPAGRANVPRRPWSLTASQHPEAVALLATLNTADRAAVWAALRAKDTEALKKVLKSESVLPIIADLRAKGLISTRKAGKSEAKAPKSDAPTRAAPAGPPVPPAAARPTPVAATRRPGDVAASSSAVRSEDARGTVPVKSANGAAPAAAPKSENTGASTAAPKSGKPAAPSVAPGAGATAVSPKTTAARGVALEGKAAAAVRTKSAAAKAAAAKLKAAATTLAARKAKKRAQCQEPVLCVFEADMRCPWHTVVPDVRFPAEGDAAVPKVEVKEERADEPEGFPPASKKIKMELDQLAPDIGCIVGEVEMKLGVLRLSQMETNDDAADDAASVSGSGNQADLSTESTLSATSPRADDDDEMDVDVEAGEVMLQPPLGADDADLVAVAQGVAVVGAHEEVAQDDDSLTNPPAAVDEVEVS